MTPRQDRTSTAWLYRPRSVDAMSTPDSTPELPAPVTTAPAAMLTTAEVASLLRVRVDVVRKWVRDGDLPAYRIGRESRIAPADLHGWLDSRRVAS